MKYLLIIVMIGISLSCKDDPSSAGDNSTNLIPNYSFETNNSPSISGWQASGNINFFEDTPPGGGNYSAGIDEVWGPPGYVSFSLPVEAGRKIYKFSCWGKIERLPAEITVGIIRDSLISYSSVIVSDSSWKLYTISDTIETENGDSIKIFLKGSISQLLASKTYYDNCFLGIK